jgi:acylphosphatase
MMEATRFYIAGRVQGVFFRASTRAEAERLGIYGWALNLDDGRVEVLAVGPAEQIKKLAGWLEDGPPDARVDAVERIPLNSEEYGDISDFRCG